MVEVRGCLIAAKENPSWWLVMQNTGPQPEDVLKRTELVYINALSYFDSGYVRTSHVYPDRRYDTECSFRTSFRRPNRFHFEYHDRMENVPGEFVSQILRIADDWWEKEDRSEIRAVPEFLSQNGELTITSQMLPPLAPLLMPDVAGPKFTNRTDLDSVGEELVGNDLCYHLQAVGLNQLTPNQTDLWISCTRLILLKSRVTRVVDSFRSSAIVDSEYSSAPNVTEHDIDLLKSAMRTVLSRHGKERFYPESSVLIEETFYAEVRLNEAIPEAYLDRASGSRYRNSIQ